MSRAAATDVPARALLPFLLLTFAIAWGVMGLFLAAPLWVVDVFGPVSGRNPLFVLAVYAPAISAVLIVITTTGRRGLGRFLARLGSWRGSPGGWGFLIFGIPLIYVAGSLMKGNLSSWGEGWSDAIGLAGAIAFAFVLGPVEELGWRGVAQPILQRRLAPLWSGLVVGTIWGIWHLPAFLLSGTPQSEWGFFPFLVGSIAVSVILTPFFNATAGSLLFAALFHFQLNNPLWPDAQPYDIIFFVAAAVIVTIRHRQAMFWRGAGVARVVPS